MRAELAVLVLLVKRDPRLTAGSESDATDRRRP